MIKKLFICKEKRKHWSITVQKRCVDIINYGRVLIFFYDKVYLLYKINEVQMLIICIADLKLNLLTENGMYF